MAVTDPVFPVIVDRPPHNGLSRRFETTGRPELIGCQEPGDLGPQPRVRPLPAIYRPLRDSRPPGRRAPQKVPASEETERRSPLPKG